MPDVFLDPHVKKPKLPENAIDSSEDTEADPTKKPVNPLTAFSLTPDDVSFENQEVNERILLFLRRHPILTIPWITLTIIFFLIPPLLSLLWAQVVPAFIRLSPPMLLILVLFYYLIAFGYGFVNFLAWFYNVGIITNLRIVDIDVVGISSRNIAGTTISDLVDVEYHQNGFLQSFFDFGTLHMQTEGLKANLDFEQIPRPEKAYDVVSDLMREQSRG